MSELVTDRNLLFGRCAVHSLNEVGFDAHEVSAPNETKLSRARRGRAPLRIEGF